MARLAIHNLQFIFSHFRKGFDMSLANTLRFSVTAILLLTIFSRQVSACPTGLIFSESDKISLRIEIIGDIQSFFKNESRQDRLEISEFLLKRVLGDTEFQNNPGEYLERWTNFRGKTEALIEPDDSAQRYLESLLKQNKLVDLAVRSRSAELSVPLGVESLSQSWTRERQETLKFIVNGFLQDNYPGIEPQHASIVAFTLYSVLGDPAFAIDPVFYVLKWRSFRGDHESFNPPFDPALRFLEIAKQRGELLRLVELVKVAKIVPPANTTFVSSMWQVAEQSLLKSEVLEFLESNMSANSTFHDKSVDFFMNSVAADPWFQNDPVRFLRRWLRVPIGLSEEVSEPFDPVGGPIKKYLKTLMEQDLLELVAFRAKSANLVPKPGVQLLSDIWKDDSRRTLTYLLSHFLQTNYGHFSERHQSVIDFALNAVFADPLFLKEPYTYLGQWFENTGGEEPVRLPESAVFTFLRSKQRDRKLDDIRILAQEAGLVKPESISFFSDRF